MDRAVNPGDNFFDYANGTWSKTTEIPADKSAWGGFVELGELSTKRTRTIIEEAAKANAPAGSVQRKVGDFYASFMDEAAIEAKGVAAAQARPGPGRGDPYAFRSRPRLRRARPDRSSHPVRSPGRPGLEGQYALLRLCRPGRPRPPRSRLLSGCDQSEVRRSQGQVQDSHRHHAAPRRNRRSRSPRRANPAASRPRSPKRTGPGSRAARSRSSTIR